MVDSRKRKGQYFTPATIARALIERALSYLESNFQNLDVLDPSIGEGVFCSEFLSLLSKNSLTVNILGYEIDSDVLQKAKISTGPLIEGKNHSLSFLKENFLTETSLYLENRKFNLIVGNPPYNATYTPKEWIKIKNSLENKSSLSLPKESSFFFVLKSLRLLKPDGILAFILPKPFVCSNRWKGFREI
ncbi:MAG: N-6 DNA methylase, partial [Candidatus Hodarchaeales archaeon]